MVDQEKIKAAATRVVMPDEPTFAQIYTSFETNAGYADAFLSFHKERDALLEKISSHQQLSEREEKQRQKIDTELEELIHTAPDGQIHGYLIGIGHLNVLEYDPIATSAMSAFYKEDPTFFHELTKFFDPGGPDFLPIREILTNNSLFADRFKLYYDAARHYQEGDVDRAEWLENLFKQLKDVASDISLVESKGQKVKDKLITYHTNLFPKKTKR